MDLQSLLSRLRWLRESVSVPQRDLSSTGPTAISAAPPPSMMQRFDEWLRGPEAATRDQEALALTKLATRGDRFAGRDPRVQSAIRIAGDPKAGLSKIMNMDDIMNYDTGDGVSLREDPFTNNASADSGSGGSAEATSRIAGMKQQGLSFGIRDRAGNIRPSTEDGAIGLRPGEQFGRQGPNGFEVWDKK